MFAENKQGVVFFCVSLQIPMRRQESTKQQYHALARIDRSRMQLLKLLIIIGVAGGATAAARASRLDESVESVMFEQGTYIAFAN